MSCLEWTYILCGVCRLRGLVHVVLWLARGRSSRNAPTEGLCVCDGHGSG